MLSDKERYDDDHVGEKPVGWPRQSIKEREDMWGADEIAQDIEDCRGCSHEYGVCDRHKGLMEGYDKAVGDMTREFDITEEDVDE